MVAFASGGRRRSEIAGLRVEQLSVEAQIVVAGGPRLGALYAGALSTVAALWFPPLLGGLAIIGLCAVLVRLNPQFREYDALHPTP